MRDILGPATVALALFLPAVVAAGPRKAGPETVNIGKVSEKLLYLSDGDGHYVALDPIAGKPIFYGDGKVFYRQRSLNWSRDDNRNTASWRLWSPQAHVPTMDAYGRLSREHASIDRKGDKWSVQCGVEVTPMHKVDDKRRRTLVKAVFKEPLHGRAPHFLARDDEGIYFYVDRMDSSLGGHDFHLYVGNSGAMVQRKLVDVVSDEIGDVFKTATGTLRINRKIKALSWKAKNGQLTDLYELDVQRQQPFIYGDLGVYQGRLGTPCDDL